MPPQLNQNIQLTLFTAAYTFEKEYTRLRAK
jgi:hypothetical protein